jgi:hypothetical protein
MEIIEIPITEEPIVLTFNCHHCKKLISLATVPHVVGYWNISCAENRKKEI